jgi:hypothetical protein
MPVDVPTGKDRIRHRYNAARSAALAGCGHGEDATDLGEAERKRWCDQAREWLRADLSARGVVRKALTRWREDPELPCVRDPDELNKLAADEREEYLALWAEVAAILTGTEK